MIHSQTSELRGSLNLSCHLYRLVSRPLEDVTYLWWCPNLSCLTTSLHRVRNPSCWEKNRPRSPGSCLSNGAHFAIWGLSCQHTLLRLLIESVGRSLRLKYTPAGMFNLVAGSLPCQWHLEAAVFSEEAQFHLRSSSSRAQLSGGFSIFAGAAPCPAPTRLGNSERQEARVSLCCLSHWLG